MSGSCALEAQFSAGGCISMTVAQYGSDQACVQPCLLRMPLRCSTQPVQAVPVLYNQLGQLTPSGLLDLLSAYATAASHSPSAYSHELFAALTEFLWEGLSELHPQGLADIAACYAAVDHYDDDEDFFGGVAAAALHKLEVRRGQSECQAARRICITWVCLCCCKFQRVHLQRQTS
jgi:hypothetical protein